MDFDQNEQNNINSIFSDLTVLNNVPRLEILNYLNTNRREHSFMELSKEFKDIDKHLLMSHLRILYVSQMIKNDGFRDKTKYSITNKGNELIEKLKHDDTAASIISEVIG